MPTMVESREISQYYLDSRRFRKGVLGLKAKAHTANAMTKNKRFAKRDTAAAPTDMTEGGMGADDQIFSTSLLPFDY